MGYYNFFIFTTKKTYRPPSSDTESLNQNPIANVTGPSNGYVNETIIFSAHYSYDPDGEIIGYRWDFNNDGIYETDWIEDILVTSTYFQEDDYTVKLQVIDDENATSIAFYSITIKRPMPPLQIPIAQANGPYRTFINESISFNSSGSYDPDGIIISYIWDLGDHNISTIKNPTHAYSKAGNYIIILRVIDNDNLSNAAIATVYVRTPEKESGESLLIILIPIIFILIIIIIMLSIYLIQKRYQITQVTKKPTLKTLNDNQQSQEILDETRTLLEIIYQDVTIYINKLHHRERTNTTKLNQSDINPHELLEINISKEKEKQKGKTNYKNKKHRTK